MEEEVSEFLGGPASSPPDGVVPCCHRAGSTCPSPRRGSRPFRGSPRRGRLGRTAVQISKFVLARH